VPGGNVQAVKLRLKEKALQEATTAADAFWCEKKPIAFSFATKLHLKF